MKLDLFVLIRPSQDSEQNKESWAVKGQKDKNVDYITIIYHIWNISVPSGLILTGQLGSRPPSFVSVAQVVLVVLAVLQSLRARRRRCFGCLL